MELLPILVCLLIFFVMSNAAPDHWLKISLVDNTEFAIAMEAPLYNTFKISDLTLVKVFSKNLSNSWTVIPDSFVEFIKNIESIEKEAFLCQDLSLDVNSFTDCLNWREIFEVHFSDDGEKISYEEYVVMPFHVAIREKRIAPNNGRASPPVFLTLPILVHPEIQTERAGESGSDFYTRATHFEFSNHFTGLRLEKKDILKSININSFLTHEFFITPAKSDSPVAPPLTDLCWISTNIESVRDKISYFKIQFSVLYTSGWMDVHINHGPEYIMEIVKTFADIHPNTITILKLVPISNYLTGLRLAVPDLIDCLLREKEAIINFIRHVPQQGFAPHPHPHPNSEEKEGWKNIIVTKVTEDSEMVYVHFELL